MLEDEFLFTNVYVRINAIILRYPRVKHVIFLHDELRELERFTPGLMERNGMLHTWVNGEKWNASHLG